MASNKLSRAEFVSNLADKVGTTKSGADRMLSAVLDTVKDSLLEGREVSLVGFGSFSIRRRKARVGRNPTSGAQINIKEHSVPAFKASKTLRDAVSEARET